ncbi:HAD-IB family hydrolase [Ferrimonas lipolytica]|uniref:HAD-IB family hydrolase n=1 Tax=Ferrimonas lipolytica TaxID=2724191 RepID=A0A6H1UAN2_9GAMM|nr:HAD-IB family hydrolase [Ferrimonas lipolytica]QIZ76111.1 HAD-IB family hydrolase [Ferrimonas lipolytica]
MTKPNLALFDFDGTLTHNDNFSAFLWFATPVWRMALACPLLVPLKWAWQQGWLSSAITRRSVTRLAYTGRRRERLEQLGQRYIAGRQQHIFRPDMLAKLHQHQQQGDTVVLVSASLNLYLQPWCRQNGITLLCSELSYIGNCASGGYQQGDCANQIKAQRVLARFDLSQYERIYAYGDSDEDLPLLALADFPYLNGSPYKKSTT